LIVYFLAKILLYILFKSKIHVNLIELSSFNFCILLICHMSMVVVHRCRLVEVEVVVDMVVGMVVVVVGMEEQRRLLVVGMVVDMVVVVDMVGRRTLVVVGRLEHMVVVVVERRLEQLLGKFSYSGEDKLGVVVVVEEQVVLEVLVALVVLVVLHILPILVVLVVLVVPYILGFLVVLVVP